MRPGTARNWKIMRRWYLLGRGDLRKRVLGNSCNAVVGMRLRLPLGHLTSFSSAFDTVIAVFVVRGKVPEKLTVAFRHFFARVEDLSKSSCEVLEGLLVEVVLVSL
jgi:hypothetical protein